MEYNIQAEMHLRVRKLNFSDESLSSFQPLDRPPDKKPRLTQESEQSLSSESDSVKLDRAREKKQRPPPPPPQELRPTQESEQSSSSDSDSVKRDRSPKRRKKRRRDRFRDRSPKRSPKKPILVFRTFCPGERVLTIAASNAAVPEPVNIKTSLLVSKTFCILSVIR